MSTKNTHKKSAKPKPRQHQPLNMNEITAEINKVKGDYEKLKSLIMTTEADLITFGNDVKSTGDKFAEPKNVLISAIESTLGNIHKSKGIVEIATNLINSHNSGFATPDDALSSSMTLANVLVELHEQFTTHVSIPYTDICTKMSSYYRILKDNKEFPYDE